MKRQHLSGHKLVALAVAISASLPAAVYAQQTVLEEIVVTATKRTTLLQDTSESIQALSADMLNNVQAGDFLEFFRLVPNLSQSNNLGPGNKRYAVRGLSSGGEPLVGVYYDETPALGSPGETLDPGASQPDIRLWDIERIEVLKGPQGTLYGNGSMGGTIRIISNKPDATASDFALQGKLGTIKSGGQEYNVNAMVNVPLIEDQLAIRMTGYYDKNDGFIDETFLSGNDVNDQETSGGRFAIRWTPIERLALTSTTYYQKTETGANFEVFEGYGSKGSPAAAQLTRTPFDDEILLANATLEYGFDSADFLYSFSYQEREVKRFDDQTRFIIFGLAGLPPFLCPDSALADGSCYDLINAGPFGTVVPANSAAVENNISRVHEARLTSSTEGPWDWTIGFYYESRSTTRRGQVAVTDANGYMVFDENGNAENRIFARNNNGNREHYATFGELSYEFVPAWTATVGARWFKTKRSERQNLVQNFGPGPTGQLPTEKSSKEDTVFRYKLAWEATDDLLLYASASEGFRVGGPNQPVGFDASAPPFNADSLWNYEFGWKSSWRDNSVTLNGAVFYVDWSNVQFVTTDPTGAFTLIGNAGDAKVTGFELELQALPFEGLMVSAGVGYNHARFDGPQPVQGLLRNQTMDGDRLEGVPDWSTSLFVQYTRPLNTDWLGGGVNAVVNSDWSYRSSKTTGFRPEAGNFRELDNYHVVNLRGGLVAEKWDLWLGVKNLFDVLPEISGRVVDNDPFKFATVQPRTFEISLGYHY